MANVKIGDLSAIADPISTDVLPIVDVSADTTNKISIEDLLKNAAAGTAAAPAFAFDDDPDTGIYRTGADGLGFSTGGTGRLFIDSSGNVGVGTSSPGAPLEVAGSTNGDQLRITQSGQYYRIGREGSGGLLEFWGAQSGYNGYIFGGADGERLRIDSSGRVGIGTSSADLPLVIKKTSAGGTGGAIRLLNNSTTTGSKASLIFTTTTNETYNSARIDGERDATGTNIIFSSSDVERLRIDSSGNVGIGTSAPFSSNGTNLHVRSTGTARLWLESTTVSTGRQFYVESLGTGGFTVVDGTAGAERLRIDSAGNVGIGTSGGATGFNNILRQKPSGGASGYFAEGANSDTWLGLYSGTGTGDSAALFYPSTGSFRIGSTTTTGTTGFSEKLRITNAGNVGIGTSSPDERLDVAGNIVATDTSPYIKIQASSTGVPNLYFNQDATRRAFLRYQNVGQFDIINEYGDVAIWTGTSGSETQKVTVTSSGNVGINNTSPAYKLDVSGSIKASTQGRFGNGSAGAPSYAFDSDSDTGMYRATTNALGFATSGSERLRIDSSGNVGIGTSSAQGKLQVYTSSLNSSTGYNGQDFGIVVETENQDALGDEGNGICFTQQYTIDASDSSKVRTGAIIGFKDAASGGFGGGLKFKVQPSGANPLSTSMTLKENGNVGIGTTSPTADLEIEKTTSASLEVGNTLGQRVRIEGGSSGISFTTPNALNMTFGTSNTERLRIDSSGNVAVGSTSPQARLEVRQDSSTVYDSSDDGAQRTGTSSICITNHNGSTNSFSQLVFDTASSNQSIARIVAIRTATSSNDLAFVVEGSNTKREAIRIASSGNVGIGSTSPQSPFVVSNGNANGIEIRPVQSDIIAFNRATSQWGNLILNSANNIFQVQGGEVGRFDNSGRLLVGTSSGHNIGGTLGNAQVSGAGTQVHFVSTSTAPSYINLAAGSSGTNVTSSTTLGRIQFFGYHTNGYDTAARIEAAVDGTPGDGDLPTRLTFSTTADGASSPTERMRIGSAGQIGLGGANYGTAGQVLTSNGSSSAPTWQNAGSGSGLFSDYAIFTHETASDGGDATASTWNTRPINTTEVSQTWASLSSNQITLDAGTYLVEWASTVYDVTLNQSRLRNTTDSTTAALGTTGRARAGDEDVYTSTGVTKLVLTASKTFEIQHWVSNTKATSGFGLDINSGENNIFGILKILKHS